MPARFIAAFVAICTLATAARSADTESAAAGLIARVPTPERVQELREQWKTSSSESEQDHARKALLSGVEDFRKLKSLIRIGSSVFDYRGLLALSDSNSYDSKEHLYRIRVGMYALIGEGSNQCIFKVCFDDKGVIKKIEPVLLSL